MNRSTPGLPVHHTSQMVLVVKNSSANAGDMRWGFNPWIRKILRRRARQPTLVFLPEELHGQRSMEGYRAWGHKQSEMTEWLTHTHTHTHTHTLVDPPELGIKLGSLALQADSLSAELPGKPPQNTHTYSISTYQIVLLCGGWGGSCSK